MEYPRYLEMKDSGVEWLGEIPEHWETTKLKYYIKLFSGESPKKDSEGIYNIYGSNGVIGKTNNYNVEKKRILIGRVGACGSINVVKDKAWVSDNALIVKIVKENFHFNFVKYLLNSLELDRLVTKNAQPLITSTKIKNLYAPIPSTENQKLIADFLDQETDRIDKLIDKKERLIELLEEKRQAMISETVTKGLNLDVEMKDSGVEGIDKIPKHWDVVKLKYLTKKIVDGTHQTPSYTDNGIPFLRVTDITDIKDSQIDFNNVKFISEDEHKDLTKNFKPQKGDLLLSKNGTIGIPKVVDWEKEFSFFVSLCLIRFKSDCNVNFGFYFFKSASVETQIKIGSKTNTVTNLHLNEINNFYLPLPPEDEQREIINYLDEEVARVNNLINKVKIQISNLKEHRKTLITKAVTGKIDVRELVEYEGEDINAC